MKVSGNFQRIIVFIVFFMPVLMYGQVRLPKLISDGMVLQRDSDIKIWGWASPGEEVLIDFLDSAYHAKTNSSGLWEVNFRELKAGGPYNMVISGKNKIEIKDVLIGDVWICSGQSNMELPIKRVLPLYPDEVKNAGNAYIRYFKVPQKYNFVEALRDYESGYWQSAEPQNVLEFSAVAYFFAKEIYDRYQVPVGLIQTAVGGSPAEAWISETTLKSFPAYFEEAQKFKDQNLIREIEEKDNERIQGWYKALNLKDNAYKTIQRWYDPELNTSDWKSMEIPGYWAETETGEINGVVWFRKDVEISSMNRDEPAKLNLGRIVDADSVFVNGRFVGSTSYQYPPRWYNIPPQILKEGKNTIAVRVINERGRGGFVKDKPYELVAGNITYNLQGNWKYKVGVAMEPLQGQTFIRWKPLGLYNAMIAPATSFKVKGVLWYQGESNAGRPHDYLELFSALVKDWRNKWEEETLPFLFVQLANFMEPKDHPEESSWASLREMQRKALSIPGTAMAVAIDLGEWNDIHPLNKMDVGKRLALAARKVVYNEDLVYSGPLFRSMEIKKNKAILSFDQIGGGLVAKDSKALRHFAIAGADKKYIWAEAKISGNKVIVWHKNVPKPVSVRYAWADNPDGANLYNKEGLPAAPFCTEE